MENNNKYLKVEDALIDKDSILLVTRDNESISLGYDLDPITYPVVIIRGKGYNITYTLRFDNKEERDKEFDRIVDELVMG